MANNIVGEFYIDNTRHSFYLYEGVTPVWDYKGVFANLQNLSGGTPPDMGFWIDTSGGNVWWQQVLIGNFQGGGFGASGAPGGTGGTGGVGASGASGGVGASGGTGGTGGIGASGASGMPGGSGGTGGTGRPGASGASGIPGPPGPPGSGGGGTGGSYNLFAGLAIGGF